MEYCCRIFKKRTQSSSLKRILNYNLLNITLQTGFAGMVIDYSILECNVIDLIFYYYFCPSSPGFLFKNTNYVVFTRVGHSCIFVLIVLLKSDRIYLPDYYGEFYLWPKTWNIAPGVRRKALPKVLQMFNRLSLPY